MDLSPKFETSFLLFFLILIYSITYNFIFFCLFTLYYISVMFLLYFEYILLRVFMNDPLNQAILLRERIAEKQRRLEQIKIESHNLDTVINFKVNSLVKSEFEQICKDAY